MRPSRIRLNEAMVSMALAALVAPAASSQQLGAQSADSAHATPATVDPRAVQPERPTIATHAYTVARGYVEIEVGVQQARPGGATQFVAPIVVKIGVAPRLQLELQGGYVRNAAPAATTAGAILNVRNMGANAAYADVTYNAGRLPGFPSHRSAEGPMR